jgi:hypothetical protein
VGLDIRFIRRIALGTGIHFVVDDGCTLRLDESQDLTEEQLHAIGGDDSEKRRKHLYYMNKVGTDITFDCGCEIRLHCPSCGKDYVVTQQDYDSAYRRFQEDPSNN